jgi:glycosyltransferase involved in cell wall biosynthesis
MLQTSATLPAQKIPADLATDPEAQDSGRLDYFDHRKCPVSVMVLTMNEEKNIEECLQSVCDWAGEILVVDSGSTDRTLEIVRRYTPHVFSHPFENYSRQRNWALENLPIQNEWVFQIDADERVTPELAQSVKALFAGDQLNRADGYLVSRRTVFMGRPIWHGGHYPAYHLRLFLKTKGRCEERLADQHFVLNGATAKLSGDLIDVIMSDLMTWQLRHVRWAADEAHEQMTNSQEKDSLQVKASWNGTPIERRRWLRRSVYEKLPLFLRAFIYFFYRYFLRLGFLDGVEGLIFHFLHGCWYLFFVDARLYEARKCPSRKSAPQEATSANPAVSSSSPPGQGPPGEPGRNPT